MSNIYVQEPPTNGKVLLTTTLGEIEIELWSKECPKACRNFVQLCMEKFYDGTIFHRVVPNFIAQGGDPSGTGHGGESIYGEPFKNEVHSRIRFVRRGLVATANTGNNDNESQFFFTLASTPELQNKHTIFGKVGGNTLFNMIKFNELVCDREDRPNHPPKITKTEVINNPFPDIVPRTNSSEKKDSEESSKMKTKGTKNFKLLSFGEEEEEAEEETASFVPKLKGKSSHDLTNDPTLSIVPAVESEQSEELEEDFVPEVSLKSSEISAQLDAVKNKLKSGNQAAKPSTSAAVENSIVEEEDSEDERRISRQKKLSTTRNEIKSLKRELTGAKDKKDDESSKKTKVDSSNEDEEEGNEILKEFHVTIKKYAERKSDPTVSKGSQREAQTLALLQKFKQNMASVKSKPSHENGSGSEDDPSDGSWMDHVLKCEDAAPTLARDANTKGDDWFEIYDPRNPLNQRRREESKKLMKEKGKAKNKDDNL